jgi:hypothetical protein
MNPLEEQLRKSLRRKEPPIDFEEKVLAGIAMLATRKPGLWKRLKFGFQLHQLRFATASLAVILLISMSVGGYYRYRRIQAEGEAAKSQVMLALQIASNRLNHAQKVVLERSNRPAPGGLIGQ